MNKAVLIGRLTRDPDIRTTNTQNGESLTIARYTLAVDRRFAKQGTKICVTGRIQTGSYTNKEGQKVFTTEVVVEEHEFVESKRDSQNQAPAYNTQSANAEGFMNIPEGIDNDLPFKK